MTKKVFYQYLATKKKGESLNNWIRRIKKEAKSKAQKKNTNMIIHKGLCFIFKKNKISIN